MAEKRKYNSKINAKGLEKAVSEEQARHMATHQGNTYTFIVQAHAGPKTVDEDGSEVVSLIPDLVELVPTEHEDRIHSYQRALYLARPEQFGQQAFEAGPDEQSADQAGGDVDALVERDEAGNVTGVWDGDLDAPLDPPTEQVGSPQCDYPGCVLPPHEDGDHEVQESAEGSGSTGGTVSSPDFSGRKKA